MKKTVALLLLFIMMSLTLSGCQTGQKFESEESMISSMKGTYAASGEHSGEYLVIDSEHITRFNMNDLFPQTIDDAFFNKNFPDEDWDAFNVDVLLNKPYVEVTTKAISVDTRNSLLSDLWIDKDGTLYSQKKNGYPFEKISSESNYPTEEMIERFKTFSQSLQEYEILSIIKEAEENVSEQKNALETALASATETSSKGKSPASAETIASCAFDSLKTFFKYPATAKLVDYTSKPDKDSYGRVSTLIRCTYQNGFGNYITEDIFVILQSCSYSGQYTYLSGGTHYSIDPSDWNITLLKSLNSWDKDPDYNASKDGTYSQALNFAKRGKYESAINLLKTLEGYRSSEKVITACENCFLSQEYKDGIALFADKQYDEAAKQLSSLAKVGENGYLRTKRAIYLCQFLANRDAKKDEDPPMEESKDNGSNNSVDNVSNRDTNG